MRWACIVLLFSMSLLVAADSIQSGVTVGQRPGPYSFLVATGPQRGQQTCYICETDTKPAAIVFARGVSEPLGKLLLKFDQAVLAQPKDTMRSWLTILGESIISLDDLAKWSKQTGLKNVPVGIFDDADGPPSYKLNPDAEVTVLLFVNKKVIANFAYRSGELNEDRINQIAKELTKLTEKK